MTRRRFRSWLFWLLMVCVPVQGFATVMGGCCARGQSRAALVASTEHGDDELVSCDEHETAPATAAVMPAKAAKHCHCASCWLGATAPPSQMVEPFADCVPRGVSSPAKSRFANFIPSGPERPPKHSTSLC